MSYNPNFFAGHLVSVPRVSQSIETRIKDYTSKSLSEFDLEYTNFNLLQNPMRGFPFYTAANINGALFKKIDRKKVFEGGDIWQKDNRILEQYQFGKELYEAPRSEFDRGHITKREDVQWGETIDDARVAAQSTYFYTNSVPQMAKLNRGIWKSLEYYILHSEAVKNHKKICLFTGPVFTHNDPDFVTPIGNKKVKLPFLFWKIVYFIQNEKLYRTGFLLSQKKAMECKEVIEETFRDEVEEDSFNMFKSAETYQVNIKTIENLTQLKFHQAEESYVDDRPTQLIMEEIEHRNEEKEIDYSDWEGAANITIYNITL